MFIGHSYIQIMNSGTLVLSDFVSCSKRFLFDMGVSISALPYDTCTMYKNLLYRAIY